jgi:hypothetical protein
LSELAGVHAICDLAAVQPAIAIDIEAVGAAGDRAMLVNQADPRRGIEEGADVGVRSADAGLDFGLHGFR